MNYFLAVRYTFALLLFTVLSIQAVRASDSALNPSNVDGLPEFVSDKLKSSDFELFIGDDKRKLR